MDAAVRCGVGITLMNRFATVVKQRKIHVSFAGGGRELATAVFPQPARRHRKYADRGQKPGATTYHRTDIQGRFSILESGKIADKQVDQDASTSGLLRFLIVPSLILRQFCSRSGSDDTVYR